MIRKDGLEFHAAELRKASGVDGWIPARIPAQIGDQLNERGRFIASDSVTTEIRFVTDARRIRLTLSAHQPEFGLDQLEIRVFCGDFQYQAFWLKPGCITTVTLFPPNELTKIREEYLRRGPGIGFAPDVWRIQSQRGELIYCGIETFGHAVRPPESSEKPAKTCLFYGSSLTNSTLDGFPSVACKRLGWDLLNLGMSGSCHVEPCLSDWMASLDGWDLAVFELGINVITVIDAEEFRNRVDHLLDVFTSRHPGKPLVLITLFPSIYRAELRKEPLPEDREGAFRRVLRELYEKYRSRGNLHLLEGDELLDDLGALGTDFVHPKNYGHAVIGLKLAEKLKTLI
ncbi:MAG: hypothetical protein J5944_09510 [Lentisphaeria bacterium]|nr:hypothetical protein [Lentisphaeria bacterium]